MYTPQAMVQRIRGFPCEREPCILTYTTVNNKLQNALLQRCLILQCVISESFRDPTRPIKPSWPHRKRKGDSMTCSWGDLNGLPPTQHWMRGVVPADNTVYNWQLLIKVVLNGVTQQVCLYSDTLLQYGFEAWLNWVVEWRVQVQLHTRSLNPDLLLAKVNMGEEKLIRHRNNARCLIAVIKLESIECIPNSNKNRNYWVIHVHLYL